MGFFGLCQPWGDAFKICRATENCVLCQNLEVCIDVVIAAVIRMFIR